MIHWIDNASFRTATANSMEPEKGMMWAEEKTDTVPAFYPTDTTEGNIEWVQKAQ